MTAVVVAVRRNQREVTMDQELAKSEKRLQLREVNPYLICVLCGGYFVDAASIVECLHTFCWTCIVKYLEKNKFCPICDVQAYKTKPHLSIRPDYTIQRLTYKMVPGLFAKEMKRRKEFYLSSDPPPTAVNLPPSAFYSPDDNISLSLEYYEAGMNNNDEKCRQAGDEHDSLKMKLLPHKRYLQCPAAVTINHLKKFVRMKYGLAAEQMVDIIYQEECLPEDFSLMDVAYTFMWDRTTPMRFSYRILERAAVPAESNSDINGAHGYSASKNDFKRNSWPRNGPNSSSESGTTNTTNGRQLRGNVFSKRKSDSGNESNEASTKDEADELDDLSLVKRLRMNARQTRSSNKKASPRRRSRSTSTKRKKQKKTAIESDALSGYSSATSPDYPSSSVPSNVDEMDSFDDDAKYEDDIEEITDDFDDDDDEGRLWISPTEDETKDKDSEVTSQESSGDIDMDDDEKMVIDPSEEIDDRSEVKVKKKSKKGKHHHHHHHHHRHTKKTPPATILKSESNDIMKLKVKLNPIIACEKYDKPSKSSSKSRTVGEVVPMYSSNSRLTADSANDSKSNAFNNNAGITNVSNKLSNKTNERRKSTDRSCSKISSSSDISSSTSRLKSGSCNSSKDYDNIAHNSFADDSSQGSRVSEENAELKRAMDVINEDLECQEVASKVADAKVPKVPEKSYRPPSLPQSLPNSTSFTRKSSPTPLIFTTCDSNSSRSKSPLLHPPSSITVSKITAAEKRKLDEDKLLNNNQDPKAADNLRPSLEIMLVNGPKMQSFFNVDSKKDASRLKGNNGQTVKSSIPASHCTSVSTSVSSSSSASLSTSPLVRLQKMSINLPSVTVTHSTSTSKTTNTSKTVVQNKNEPCIQAGSIEISLQKENTAPTRIENRDMKKTDGQKKGTVGSTGALDLSPTSQLTRPSVSGASSGTVHTSSSTNHSNITLKRPKSVPPVCIKPQVNKIPPQLNTGKVGSTNGPKSIPVSMQNLTVLSNAAAHLAAKSQQDQRNTIQINGNSSPSIKSAQNPQILPASPSPKNNHSVSNLNNCLQQNMSLKIPSLQQRPIKNPSFKQDNSPVRSKPMNMPKLNEIDRKQFIRPAPHGNNSSGINTTKPGQNQFVRHITDPSVMIYARQQNASVVSGNHSSSGNSMSKKFVSGNNGRLSSPPGVIPIASMFRQGGIAREIEKVSAGLQMKTTVNKELTSVK